MYYKEKEFRRFVFFIFIVLATTIVVFGIPRLAYPLVIAYVLNLILSPVISIIKTTKIPKIIIIPLVILILSFLIIYPINYLLSESKEELANIQSYSYRVEEYLISGTAAIKNFILQKTGKEIPDSYFKAWLNYSANEGRNFLEKLPSILSTFLEWSFVVPLFLFFFLKEGRNLLRGFVKLAPNSVFEKLYYLLTKFNQQIGDYIFAKFIEALIVGLIITFGLLILDVRFSLALGLIAGITNIIPYLGPVLGMVPGIAFVLTEYGYGPIVGWVIFLYLFANIIDIAIVFPLLVSKIVDLHPLLVVVSVILGSQYMGVPGMVISVPIAAAIKLILKEIYRSLYTGDRLS